MKKVINRFQAFTSLSLILFSVGVQANCRVLVDSETDITEVYYLKQKLKNIKFTTDNKRPADYGIKREREFVDTGKVDVFGHKILMMKSWYSIWQDQRPIFKTTPAINGNNDNSQTDRELIDQFTLLGCN